MVPPVSPMLAKLTRELPEGEGLFYEPKWDGFRCIVFRDGDEVVWEAAMRSRSPDTFPSWSNPCWPTCRIAVYWTARS